MNLSRRGFLGLLAAAPAVTLPTPTPWLRSVSAGGISPASGILIRGRDLAAMAITPDKIARAAALRLAVEVERSAIQTYLAANL